MVDGWRSIVDCGCAGAQGCSGIKSVDCGIWGCGDAGMPECGNAGMWKDVLTVSDSHAYSYILYMPHTCFYDSERHSVVPVPMIVNDGCANAIAISAISY